MLVKNAPKHAKQTKHRNMNPGAAHWLRARDWDPNLFHPPLVLMATVAPLIKARMGDLPSQWRSKLYPLMFKPSVAYSACWCLFSRRGAFPLLQDNEDSISS